MLELLITLSCGRIGALWLEPSTLTPVVDDAVITNNTLRGEATHISRVFRIYNGAKTATNSGNVVSNGLCADLNMDANP